jgi:hypothetical protein
MTLTVAANALQIITYFTPFSGSPPIQLNIGDTLTATFRMMFNGVPPNGSTSQGFRFGLFDFADGSNSPLRVSSDGFSSSSQGSFVQGYSLFGKMYGTFSDATPIDIRKRTALSDGSLLGTSGDWTSLAKSSLTTNSFEHTTVRVAADRCELDDGDNHLVEPDHGRDIVGIDDRQLRDGFQF